MHPALQVILQHSPTGRKMAEGGMMEETEGQSDPLILAAETIMDVLSSGGAFPVSEHASPVERMSQGAAKKAKAEVLAEALCDFFDLYEMQPHEETPHEEE